MIAVWGSVEKTRRIVREYGRHRFRYNIGELILTDVIPGIEEEAAIRFEDPSRLDITGDPVCKKYNDELSINSIE